MGKRRVIDSKIRKSQTFASLTYRQRDLWQGLIETADDQGRHVGLPASVRSEVWPLDDITLADVEADLNALESVGYIHRYTVEGCQYIQIINWWKYQSMQWSGPSDYPPPPGWVDRERYHGRGNAILLQNWDQAGGFSGDKGSKLHSQQGSVLPSDESEDYLSRDVNGDVNGDGDDKELNSVADATTSQPESSSNSRKKREPSEKELKRDELLRFFLMKTGLPAPRFRNKTEAKETQRLWRTPLSEILEMVDCDVRKACVLVEAAITKLRRSGLTISDPNSILKTARAEFAEYNNAQ